MPLPPSPLSPNMGLSIPVPGITPDPLWANQVSNDLTIIDAEAFSANNPVPTSGIVIDADLSLSGSSLTNVDVVQFTSQSGTLGSSTTDSFYVVDGDAYFNNALGVPVRITDNNQLASSGSQVYQLHTVAGNLTIPANATYNVLLVNTNADRLITLPQASLTAGTPFFIVDDTGTAGTNPIQLAAQAGDTVGLEVQQFLSQDAGTWMVISDGASNWSFLASQQSIVFNPVEFQENVRFDSDIFINGEVSGPLAQVAGNVSLADGALQIVDNSLGTGASTFVGNLEVKGTTQLDQNLTALGAANVMNGLEVLTNQVIIGNLAVLGTGSLQTLQVAETSLFGGAVTAQSNVTIQQDLTIQQSLVVDQAMVVAGDAVLGGASTTVSNLTPVRLAPNTGPSTVITSNYTIKSTDYALRVDCSNNNVLLTFPGPAGQTTRQVLHVILYSTNDTYFINFQGNFNGLLEIPWQLNNPGPNNGMYGIHVETFISDPDLNTWFGSSGAIAGT